jgi:hypothetical protein
MSAAQAAALAAVTGAYGVITFAAATGAKAIDPASDNTWIVQAVGDVDLARGANDYVPGMEYVVEFQQDGIGGRNLAMTGTAVTFPDGVNDLTPNPAPSSITVYSFRATAAGALLLTSIVSGSPLGALGVQSIPGATGIENIDPSLYGSFVVSAVGNVTLTPTDDFIVGQDYVVQFVQDATGSRGLAFDAGVTVDLPSGVTSLIPDTRPSAVSTFVFRATGVASLLLVAVTTAVYEYVNTYSIYGQDDYDLFVVGGSVVADPLATWGISLDLGAGKIADSLTGPFKVGARDRAVPFNPYDALKLQVLVGVGPNYVPTRATVSSEILVALEDIESIEGKDDNELTLKAGLNTASAAGVRMSTVLDLGVSDHVSFETGRFIFRTRQQAFPNTVYTVADFFVHTGAGPTYTPDLVVLDVGGSGLPFVVKCAAIERIRVDENGVDVNGARVKFQQVTLAADTALIDRVVVCRALAAALTAPNSSAAIDGQSFTVKNRVAGDVVVTGAGGDTFDGAATYTVATGQSATFTWDETAGEWLCFPGA